MEPSNLAPELLPIIPGELEPEEPEEAEEESMSVILRK